MRTHLFLLHQLVFSLLQLLQHQKPAQQPSQPFSSVPPPSSSFSALTIAVRGLSVSVLPLPSSF